MLLEALPVALIYGNPDQPRKTFDPAELRALADSIRENGLKQPITVRPDGAGRFMIVMGERRWRAHQLLEADTILAQVSDVDDTQLAIDAIIENDQRVDVSPLEQARAYRRMLDEFDFTLEQLAKKLGKPVFRIEERLTLLNLEPTSMKLFETGAINPTEAYYLGKLPERLQGRMLKAIRAGDCRTMPQLAAMVQALQEEDAEVALFELAEEIPAEIVRQARSIEDALERVSALLRSAIDDNKVKAVRRVNPDRAGTIADLCAAMRTDLGRLETAFRVAAGIAGAKE